jgi:hypothetical protein
MRQISTSVEKTSLPGDEWGLVGSWSISVSESDGSPTRALFTFGADGTLVTAEHPVVTPPGAPGAIFTSSGHGAWNAAGPDAASFTYLGFGSDGQGNLFAVVTFRGNVVLDMDRHTLKGEMTATIDDPQGNTMAMFPMTLEGSRIVVETSRGPSTGTPVTASGR